MDTKNILANSKDISIDKSKALDFCTVWPGAKKGLELLRDILKNPIAKAAVSIVIAAGDAVANQMCPRG